MHNQPSVETLLQQLQDSDSKVRRQAILALGQRRSARAIFALQKVVHTDPATSCRKSALYWLRRMADRATLNAAVRYALNDPDPLIRMDAAWNVRQAGPPNPGIVEPLLRALERSQDTIAWSMIMSALGALRDARAFEPLVAYLESPSGYRRGVAAQALGVLGDPRATEYLEALLDDQAVAWEEDHGPERRVADIAREALQRLGSEMIRD